MAIATRNIRFEFEPALRDAVAVACQFLLILAKSRWFDCFQLPCQHVADLVVALHRAQVPGERDQISPIAVSLEQVDRGFDISALQRLAELGKGCVYLRVGAVFKHGISSVLLECQVANAGKLLLPRRARMIIL